MHQLELSIKCKDYAPPKLAIAAGLCHSISYDDAHKILPAIDLCYTGDAMTDHNYQEDFAEHIHHWRRWLSTHQLQGIAGTVLEIMEPLSAIGAQFLYVGQPTLKLLMPHSTIDAWAQLLESPDGLRWLRKELVETDIVDGK